MAKTVRTALTAAVTLLGASLMGPAQAATGNLTVNYDFNAGGLNVGSAKLTATLKDGRYVATSRMRTAGLAEVFFKSRYVVLSTGEVKDNGSGLEVLPSRYDSDFTGANTTKLATMIYDETGLPSPVAADPPYGKTQLKYPVSDDEQRASIDPMSAWIHMIMGASADDGAPCNRKIPIFDGRRRYDLEYELIGEETLKIRNGKIYDGPAHRCNMLYKPVEGFKPDEDDDDALPIPPLQVWVARMGKPGGPNFYVPMKLLAETPIGNVVMIADEVDFGPVRDQRKAKEKDSD